MPEASLALTLPEHLWIGELSRAYPDATFRILSAIPQESNGVALVEISSDSLDSLLEEMVAREELPDIDILNETDETTLVQFETTTPMLLFLAQDAGVPLKLPFEIADGEAVWEVTATHGSLSKLSEKLETFGISFTVESLRYEVGDAELLTEAQRELMETAVEMGYYESPRQCSLTDLADAVGRAKSTVSETLHRAEGAVIQEFVDTGPTDSEMLESLEQ